MLRPGERSLSPQGPLAGYPVDRQSPSEMCWWHMDHGAGMCHEVWKAVVAPELSEADASVITFVGMAGTHHLSRFGPLGD